MKLENLFVILDHAPDLQMDVVNLAMFLMSAEDLDIVNCCCCCCCL